MPLSDAGPESSKASNESHKKKRSRSRSRSESEGSSSGDSKSSKDSGSDSDSDSGDDSSSSRRKKSKKSKKKDKKDKKDKKKKKKKSKKEKKEKKEKRSKPSKRAKSTASSSQPSSSSDPSSSSQPVMSESLLQKLAAKNETLSERRVRKERERNARMAAKFGYSNDDNPFNDPNLDASFTWGKKVQTKRGAEVKTDTAADKRQHQEKLVDEIEKVRRRRIEREEEVRSWASPPYATILAPFVSSLTSPTPF